MGTPFFEDWDIHRYPLYIIMEDGSISTYGVEGNYIMIGPTSGNFKSFEKIYKHIARITGAKGLRTYTSRNPKAYARMSGAKLIHTIPYADGSVKYEFEWEVDNGRS